ncbi:MAG: ester cyclase [Ostreibacterium sp.]
MKIVIFALVLSLNLQVVLAEPVAYPKIGSIHIAKGLSKADAKSQLATARSYHAFWNTGLEIFSKKALAENFVDLNLPEGRPQGPTGPIIASATFRKAVPDLSLAVPNVYILKNKVINQLHFTGHFTGSFGEIKGKGQKISFSAVDIYTIKNGKIVENWHLEDNLTLLKQLGVIPKK